MTDPVLTSRNTFAIAETRAQQMSQTAGRHSIGRVLWPWWIGFQLDTVGKSETRIYGSPAASPTLDGAPAGRAPHPAARAAGWAVLLVSYLVLLVVVALSAAQLPLPVVAVVLALMVLPWPTKTVRTIPAATGHRRTKQRRDQLEAAGDKVRVLTWLVRRAGTPPGGGVQMAHTVVDQLAGDGYARWATQPTPTWPGPLSQRSGSEADEITETRCRTTPIGSAIPPPGGGQRDVIQALTGRGRRWAP